MQDTQKTTDNPADATSEQPRTWTERFWRPAGTVAAAGLALLLTWHVIYGQHGLSSWHRMRTEDKNLEIEIHKLELENQQLRNENQKLENDPDAIRLRAREQLHYAAPDEVIYTLPASETGQKK